MFVIYAVLVLQVLLAAVGVPFALWVWNEARKDYHAYGPTDPTDLKITSNLRRRNTGGIFWSQVANLLGGVIILGLVMQYGVRLEFVDDQRQIVVWVLMAVLLVASVRAIATEAILCWLSYASRKDRLRLRKYHARRDKRITDAH